MQPFMMASVEAVEDSELRLDVAELQFHFVEPSRDFNLAILFFSVLLLPSLSATS